MQDKDYKGFILVICRIYSNQLRRETFVLIELLADLR